LEFRRLFPSSTTEESFNCCCEDVGKELESFEEKLEYEGTEKF
jgi:hypothetical protein